MKLLNSLPIVTPQHVDIMRQIYNDNLESLATRPLPFRTYEEQQQWWEASKHYLNGFLYEPLTEPETVVGFLVLRDRGGFQTPMIAIKKNGWGKGYGKEMVSDYIEKAYGPLAGTQLKSNSAICHLNHKAGWMVLGEREETNGTVELLFHPGRDRTRQIEPSIFDSILDYLGQPGHRRTPYCGPGPNHQRSCRSGGTQCDGERRPHTG